MTADRPGPLAGCTVVVTRATDQAGSLADALRARGAEVVELPVIAMAEPTDGGVALAEALDRAVAGGYDWIVVTSPNGARRVAGGLDGCAFAGRIAAVGPRTAAPLVDAGHVVDLVPTRAVSEGLLAEFPAPDGDRSRVLLARAEVARAVLPEGLRAGGWEVDVVTAYRNVAPDVDAEVLAIAARADLVTFTSESTVHRYHDLFPGAVVPPVEAACIGPISAAAARQAGHEVVEAEPHSVDGLVAAVGAWAADRRRPAPEDAGSP
mgnify:CR=1 FL=1